MILVLSDLWRNFPGGAETLMGNLTDALHDAGHPVAVLTGYWDHRDEPYPINASAIQPNEHGWEIVRDAIEHYRPDVILTHHLYAYGFEAELAETRIPLVQVVLNNRRLYHAAFAVYITEWVRALCDDRPEDLVIWPPAMGDVIAPGHGDAIGFIKPIPHKGIELVYRLATLLPERRLVILRGEWQTLEDIRPAPNIRFMEPVADIRDFYQECRVLLVPSLSEDAGTVAQEATVNGLPCISSNVQGLAETNGGGILLDPHDTRGWVAAICSLDDGARYRTAVFRQQAWLDQHDTPGRLAGFVDAVAGLYP